MFFQLYKTEKHTRRVTGNKIRNLQIEYCAHNSAQPPRKKCTKKSVNSTNISFSICRLASTKPVKSAKIKSLIYF